MKMFFLVLFFCLTIGNIQSENVRRTYMIIRDKPIDDDRLFNYTIYNSTGTKRLYRLKTISTDIDTMLLVDYPAKNLIANLEGEWAWTKFHVSFSIYSYKFSKWIDGNMTKTNGVFVKKYLIGWGSKRLIMKDGVFSNTMSVYGGEKQNRLLAKFKDASSWNTANVKYRLKIYSNDIPDTIYFLAVAMIGHRRQISNANADDD